MDKSYKDSVSIKGFTLVEILIVIGVIGIIVSLVLPSLLDVREKTKDDQRVADLKSVAQSLELFKLKCGFYPGSIVNSDCRGAVSPNLSSEDPSNWQELSDILKSADYLIDLGPEGGAGGGHVVAKGTPEEVANTAKSYTGKYLRRVLGKAKK